MEYSIGIDIGGTKIAAGIINKMGSVVIKKTFSTPQETKDSIIQLLENIIFSLSETAKTEGKKLVGIGIGTAGQIDFEKGKVLSGTANIKDWNDVPLRDILSQKTDLPIFVENDVNVLALAEQQLGVGRNVENLICLALGTGVGGGVITGGKLLRGAWGGGAELGHITVDMNGPLCNCGFQGCVETYTSGTGIARMMREALITYHESEGNSELLYYQKHPEEVTSRLVFELMSAGNEVAERVVGTAINALSFAIVSMIHTFNPTLIILGGGVLQEGEWFINKVRERVGELGIRSLVDPVEIKGTQLGNDAGLIGSAIQPWVYGVDVEVIKEVNKQ
ncbi:ROK family protein [Bacillus timonensis]|uniref:ROK family protein n=1 Tax=Bacillus timonensis TaxID=1033734 RepID=UPI000288A5A4|nr:ROK family protein [Bacillus timonensis]